MNDYHIEAKNINNSLVFYRALFDLMPIMLSDSMTQFRLKDFSLTIEERNELTKNEDIMFFRLQEDAVMAAYRRVERFFGKEKWLENCEKLEDTFGITDPDGNRWQVGNPESIIPFEKCYF